MLCASSFLPVSSQIIDFTAANKHSIDLMLVCSAVARLIFMDNVKCSPFQFQTPEIEAVIVVVLLYIQNCSKFILSLLSLSVSLFPVSSGLLCFY